MNIKQVALGILCIIVFLGVTVALGVGCLFTRLIRVRPGDENFWYNDGMNRMVSPCGISVTTVHCQKFCQFVYYDPRDPQQSTSKVYITRSSNALATSVLTSGKSEAEWALGSLQESYRSQVINGTGTVDDVYLFIQGQFNVTIDYVFPDSVYLYGEIDIVANELAQVQCSQISSEANRTSGTVTWTCTSNYDLRQSAKVLFQVKYRALLRSDVMLPAIYPPVQLLAGSGRIVFHKRTIASPTSDHRCKLNTKSLVYECERLDASDVPYDIVVESQCPNTFPLTPHSYTRANLHYSKSNTRLFNRLILPYIISFLLFASVHLLITISLLYLCRSRNVDYHPHIPV